MHIDLIEALTLLCVDDLKDLSRHLPGPPVTGRKAELVDGIARALLGPDLKSLWSGLKEKQKTAVSEAVHDVLGEFSHSTFQAKYGSAPEFDASAGKARSYGPRKSTPMCLFIYRHAAEKSLGVPRDLRQRLLEFVPEPAAVQIKTQEQLVAAEDQFTRLTEADALQELTLMLRTIDSERITVGEKTGQPSTAAQRLLAAKLPTGDFYPWVEKTDKWEQQVGPIKAFAWPLLLQAGGLANRTGTRLTLSPAGVKALSAAPAEVIRTIWRKWLKTSLLDEFSRIDDIKGQNSAGRVMSAVAPRRAMVDEALQACPAGVWIDVDEFSRFMQASDLRFIVAHDPWKLFISDRQYGSLGYEGSNGWNILQHRYILALLFEYAATLGLVDAAYFDPTDPQSGVDDFRSMWGADDLTFLSRYDGLSHFRINALGAFVLGITGTYQPAAPVSAVVFNIMPSLSMGVTSGVLDAQSRLMLDTWAQALPDELWLLDRAKALSALEKGHDINVLHQFLTQHASAPPPDSLAVFVTEAQTNAKAVKLSAQAVLMTCRDVSTAQHIAEHPLMQRLCWRVDPKTLVVRSDQLDKFRDGLRQLGLGLVG